MDNLNPKAIRARFEKVKSNRVNWDDTWQRLAHYCLPHKENITSERTAGERFPTDIYDSTPIQSVNLFAAGLHGYLTSPSTKWFSLRLNNEELMDNKQVKLWLEDSEKKIYNVLNSSNFSQQVHEMYMDFGVFGTACLYEEEDPEEVVRFDARPPKEIYLIEDSKGKVNQIYRLYKLSAEQAFEKFGDKAFKNTKKILKEDPMKEYEYLQCVGVRNSRDVSKKDSANKPIYSITLNYTETTKVNTSGYDEMPFMTPRFNKTSSEVYGYSPANLSEADIKTANKIMELVLKAAGKMIDPPVVLPNSGYLLPLDMRAGAINYRNAGLNSDGIEELKMHGEPKLGIELLEYIDNSIKRNFFVDLFLMLENSPKMTATEVIQRAEEKMLILGPVLGRLQSELLDMIITRTFNILYRRGIIKDAPPQIQGETYEVEYVSRLAKAQKLSTNQSIQNFLAVVGNIAQFSPEALDKINVDEVVDTLADVMGVTPQIVRDMKEVSMIRQQRAELQQQQMELQAAQQVANVAQTGAKAGVDIDSIMKGNQ